MPVPLIATSLFFTHLVLFCEGSCPEGSSVEHKTHFLGKYLRCHLCRRQPSWGCY